MYYYEILSTGNGKMIVKQVPSTNIALVHRVCTGGGGELVQAKLQDRHTNTKYACSE